MSVSLRDALTHGAGQLQDAGVESAHRDVRELAAFVCDVDLTQLVSVTRLSADQWQRLQDLVAERARRTPLQHLTGVAHFRYLTLRVGPGVFVPRPETEMLVEWGLSSVQGVENPLVIDACAGSGAIALSVAHECAGAHVHAVEREEHAAAWLRANAEGSDVRVCEGDVTDLDTLQEFDSRVDLVLSNPPYVPLESCVAPEAAEHDPASALWGGDDGLDVVRPLAVRAYAWLRPGGWFGVEHGEQHASAVGQILQDAGFTQVDTLIDLTRRPRFSVGQRC